MNENIFFVAAAVAVCVSNIKVQLKHLLSFTGEKFSLLLFFSFILSPAHSTTA
jgi:hypothetical protein